MKIPNVWVGVAGRAFLNGLFVGAAGMIAFMSAALFVAEAVRGNAWGAMWNWAFSVVYGMMAWRRWMRHRRGLARL